jgi:ubiquinone/menaquinone biosynthesis C-methylase UbiE
VGRIWFLEGDACRLNLPEQSFDLVLCDGLLHHVADPAQLLAGMRRTVRSGGAVLLRDIERPFRPFCSRLLGRPPQCAPEPLRQAWENSAAAAYTLEEFSDIVACSPLAGAAVGRQADGQLVLTRRF